MNTQNSEKLQKLQDFSKGTHSLESVLKASGFMKVVNCPNCNAELQETTNTYMGEVFQRVVSCDNCGYVHSFDAPENWRDEFKDEGYESYKDYEENK